MQHVRKVFINNSYWGLVGCDAVYCCSRIPVFQRTLLPPS